MNEAITHDDLYRFPIIRIKPGHGVHLSSAFLPCFELEDLSVYRAGDKYEEVYPYA
jgi:hypothetical protein